MKTGIVAVHARQLWDSRGRPTIEAEVSLADGAVGRALAPAGASRGDHEAVDLRDGGARFGGFGVDGALENVRGPIAAALRGLDGADQAAVDAALIALDGTANKARLGGNAMVAVSLAVLRAAAAAAGEPLWRYLAGEATPRLPLPEIQIFGGGAHASRRLDVQDVMIMAPRAGSFRRALEIMADVYRAAGDLMEERGTLAGVADEGGWWPAFAANEDAFAAVTLAIERAGYRPGEEVFISLDVAANELWRDGAYHLRLDGEALEPEAMAARIMAWAGAWPILSIEDPLAQDDFEGAAKITAALGGAVQIVGDDLLVTNAARIARAAAQGAGNAALIKVNQAGTVTEGHAALTTARRAGWGTIVSARSGETEDTAIADLAVGWDAGQLKVGSFSRSERMAKWNAMLRIEEALGPAAVFAGEGALTGVRR